MVRQIVKEEALLRQPATAATAEDLQTAQDLLDTLAANREQCVGMAANMIGVAKRIIAVQDGGGILLMLNPEILKFSEPFTAEEGCLSLVGTRQAKWYRTIKVRYQNRDFGERTKTFKGWTAQIIQHEIDHCNGILI